MVFTCIMISATMASATVNTVDPFALSVSKEKLLSVIKCYNVRWLKLTAFMMIYAISNLQRTATSTKSSSCSLSINTIRGITMSEGKAIPGSE